MSNPAPTLIRVAELWLPDETGSLLEFGGGLYGAATRLGAQSRSMCFGRGEGLPGQAWERGRPIMLTELGGGYFRRSAVAAAEELTCAIALPTFAGKTLTAVLVLFCGDDETRFGAIELWHNDAATGTDMTLDEGYYGGTAEIFEFLSRQTAFREGTGLPGLTWESGLPVFMADLGKGSRLLRADSAMKVGINRGFAMPCQSTGADTFVLAFLSALATPIVRRFEVWLPDTEDRLQRKEGFCEKEQVLSATAGPVGPDQGALARAMAERRPILIEQAATEPGSVGMAARDAALGSLVAFPIVRNDAVAAVVAWYF